MTIRDHLTSFHGKDIVDFQRGMAVGPGTSVENPAEVAWRLAVDYDDSTEVFERLFRELLQTVGGDNITALVIGEWGQSYDYDNVAPVALLTEEPNALPNLKALFLGEMTYDECEISWIPQTDITPLFHTFPDLAVLEVRGGNGLELSPVRHEKLFRLVIQSGGLPPSVIRAVGASEFPGMVGLELWLGTPRYGGNARVEDLAGILAGTGLPALRSLALRDAEITDDLASALASAPIVARLRALDLSMGLLTDVGAEALLTGQPLDHLTHLDLSHHTVSEGVVERLRSELGSSLHMIDRQDRDDFFVAVGE